MLDFIYYPVSAILWFWHKAFGYVLSPDNGIAWALSVVFLVFTLRALLFKPFVGQVRSMRKMQEFAPQIQKLKERYGDDRQKMAAEMQKLQSEQGVNPLGGCLPILVQIPVFIGLFHVLRSFNRSWLSEAQNRVTPNYVFGPEEVQSFLDARLFGVPLSAYITQASEQLARFGDVSRWDIAVVAIPLMIVAGILTHFTARHSVQRQSATAAANPQAAIMNKVMLYLFPLGVLAGGPFFPLAILIYWLSNNLWTLGQQYLVYHRIDAEEAEKKEAATAQRQSLAPRPGQKPTQTRGQPGAAGNGDPRRPGTGGADAVAEPERMGSTGPAEDGEQGGEAGTDGEAETDGENRSDITRARMDGGARPKAAATGGKGGGGKGGGGKAGGGKAGGARPRAPGGGRKKNRKRR